MKPISVSQIISSIFFYFPDNAATQFSSSWYSLLARADGSSSCDSDFSPDINIVPKGSSYWLFMRVANWFLFVLIYDWWKNGWTFQREPGISLWQQASYNYLITLPEYLIQRSSGTPLPPLISPAMQEKKSQNLSEQPNCPRYFMNILYPSKKYDCNECLKEVSQYTFILYDGKYFCILCFIALRRYPGQYHVMNKLEFPILSEGWSAFEQLMLFEGLEKHGFGNWNEIADHMDTNKTKQDVEKHYSDIFLDAPNFLPDSSKIINRKNMTSKFKIPKQNGRERQTLVSRRIQNLAMDRKNPKPPTAEVVGYMPLRQDFQFEYDNEAELMLAEMQFTDDDTPETQQMKFQILEAYNQRLTERNRKKEFIFSRNILDLDKQMKIEKSRPKAEKEIYNMMKIFARFHTASEHEELVQGLIREKVLKQKIEQYRELRDRGFTTKNEIEAELERKLEAKSKKKASSNQYHFQKSAYDQPRGNHRRANFSKEDLNGISKIDNPYFSHEELDLCKQLKLSGTNYMIIKETLIRQSLKLGHIERQPTLEMFAMDKYVVGNVITFLAERDEISCLD